MIIKLLKTLSVLSLFSFSSVAFSGVPTVDASRAVIIEGEIAMSLNNVADKMDEYAKKSIKAPIDLIINSPGGSIVPGFEFISRMEELKDSGATIRCYVPHVAASMAYQILVHCSERYTTDLGFLLWHGGRVFSRAPITAEVALDLSTDLTKLNNNILIDIKAAMKDLTPAEVDYHFKRETLHVGRDLAKMAPSFITSYKTIPGLFKTLKDKKVIRNEQPGFFFKLFGNDTNPFTLILIKESLIGEAK